MKQNGLFIQMTGMSGAGKTTLARASAKILKKSHRVEIIDGDEYREGLCSDLGFSKEDRNTNIRRLGFVGKILARNGIIAIMAAINPYDAVRKELHNTPPAEHLVRTVYVRCGLDTLISRDPKGLYRRALLEDGHPEKINNFTGITDPFEPPEAPDLIIDTEKFSISSCIDELVGFVEYDLQ